MFCGFAVGSLLYVVRCDLCFILLLCMVACFNLWWFAILSLDFGFSVKLFLTLGFLLVLLVGRFATVTGLMLVLMLGFWMRFGIGGYWYVCFGLLIGWCLDWLFFGFYCYGCISVWVFLPFTCCFWLCGLVCWLVHVCGLIACCLYLDVSCCLLVSNCVLIVWITWKLCLIFILSVLFCFVIWVPFMLFLLCCLMFDWFRFLFLCCLQT